jgi:tetratricopeptide (TPR) repeat protein
VGYEISYSVSTPGKGYGNFVERIKYQPNQGKDGDMSVSIYSATLKMVTLHMQLLISLLYYGIEKAFGPDHTSTLQTVGNLGNLYADQGRLKEAEELYKRALKGMEKALGPDQYIDP